MKDSAIIVCTKNGQKFIEEQMLSIFNQTNKNFDIFINDDGSSDKTMKILNSLKTKNKNFNIQITDISYGSATKNFLNTLKKVPNCYKYYFFCDQDDIWYRNKVQRSVDVHQTFISDIPSLYCSRTVIIDAKNKSVGKSPLFRFRPSFKNAIVQSLAGGNTMCVNQKTKSLLDSIKKINSVTSHDWMCYLLVSGNNGNIYYDTIPSLSYRKHNNNQIGPNQSLSARLKRLQKLFKGEFREWTKSNITVLQDLKLSRSSKTFLKTFKTKVHEGDIFNRISYIIRLGVYRQNLLSTLVLIFSVMIKKI
tara:strand:+ start:7150 stop:8067 length:918 start_codon:yes stop_codon:yes gene_type:complete